MLDRLRLGYVVDFVDVGIGTTRFYTFNVADRAISLAILLLFIAALRPSLVEGGERRRPGPRPATPAARRPVATTGTTARATAGDPADEPRDPPTHALDVPPMARAQRVDRYVADVTGPVAEPRPEADRGRPPDRAGVPIKANAVIGPATALRADGAPEPEPLDLAPAEAIPVQRRLRGRRPADRRQAGRPRRPSVAGTHAAGRSSTPCSASAAAAAFGGIAGVQRPGIVHRLDRDTSGLLMVARTDAAQHSLMAQLKARRVKKTYLALVLGEVSAEVGRIEAPIGRDPKHRTRMAVVPDGRASTTGYRVRERFRGWTLLELDLVTGRTHQIRVHLEAIGHPVAGDPVYGTGTSRGPAGPATALERLFLHAWRLQLDVAERRPA